MRPDQCASILPGSASVSSTTRPSAILALPREVNRSEKGGGCYGIANSIEPNLNLLDGVNDAKEAGTPATCGG
jgi:hypothetical protein